MIHTHVEQENIALIRRGFDAFAKADLATLKELFHNDATWHVPPSGVLSGNYRGRDAILAFFGQLYAETAGTFRSHPDTFAATGDDVFVETTLSGSRNGRTVSSRSVLVFTVIEGRTREVREYTFDHAVRAQFFS